MGAALRWQGPRARELRRALCRPLLLLLVVVLGLTVVLLLLVVLLLVLAVRLGWCGLGLAPPCAWRQLPQGPSCRPVALAVLQHRKRRQQHNSVVVNL
jgi:hypothetical protein